MTMTMSRSINGVSDIRLPAELWLQISSHLQWRDILPLSLLCHSIRPLLYARLFKNLRPIIWFFSAGAHITRSAEELEANFAFFTSENVAPFVQHCWIKFPPEGKKGAPASEANIATHTLIGTLLPPLVNLTSITFERAVFKSADFEVLSTLPRLNTLHLKSCRSQTRTLQALPHIQHLKTNNADIRFHQFTPIWKAVFNPSTLETLHFSRMAPIDGIQIFNLLSPESWSRLRALSIGSDVLSSGHWPAFFAAFPNLEELCFTPDSSGKYLYDTVEDFPGDVLGRLKTYSGPMNLGNTLASSPGRPIQHLTVGNILNPVGFLDFFDVQDMLGRVGYALGERLVSLEFKVFDLTYEVLELVFNALRQLRAFSLTANEIDPVDDDDDDDDDDDEPHDVDCLEDQDELCTWISKLPLPSSIEYFHIMTLGVAVAFTMNRESRLRPSPHNAHHFPLFNFENRPAAELKTPNLRYLEYALFGGQVIARYDPVGGKLVEKAVRKEEWVRMDDEKRGRL